MPTIKGGRSSHNMLFNPCGMKCKTATYSCVPKCCDEEKDNAQYTCEDVKHVICGIIERNLQRTFTLADSLTQLICDLNYPPFDCVIPIRFQLESDPNSEMIDIVTIQTGQCIQNDNISLSITRYVLFVDDIECITISITI